MALYRVHLESVAMKWHEGLVYSQAHRFKGQIPLDDLAQVGFIGLVKALRSFDPAFGYQLSTYAVPFIRGEMLHYIRDYGRMVRLPQRLQRITALSAAKAHRKLTPDEEAELAAVKPEVLMAAESATGFTTEDIDAVRVDDYLAYVSNNPVEHEEQAAIAFYKRASHGISASSKPSIRLLEAMLREPDNYASKDWNRLIEGFIEASARPLSVQENLIQIKERPRRGRAARHKAGAGGARRASSKPQHVSNEQGSLDFGHLIFADLAANAA